MKTYAARVDPVEYATIIRAAIAATGGDHSARYLVSDSADGFWTKAETGERLPEQGWKLHVSSGIADSVEVLSRCLPVLIGRGATFKVALDATLLATLNGGFGGNHQVGKFITVYPASDREAIALALELDRATRGFRGPRVPTDRRVSEGSLVSYRYGAFTGRTMRTRIGETVPAILDPDGTLVPDVRSGTFDPPGWVEDPFSKAGLGEPERTFTPLVGERFLILQVLHQSARGMVLFGIDLQSGRRVVLKQASAADEIGNPSLEARAGLKREHELLRALHGIAAVPEPVALLRGANDEHLVMEFVEGETLEEWMRPQLLEGRLPPVETTARMTLELARFLAALHERGLVHGDLKSANVLVEPTGALRVIDFDLVFPAGSLLPAGTGTQGYLSARRTVGEPTATGDDLYALGALVYFMLTGAEPSQGPRAKSLLARPLGLMRPELTPALAARLTRFVERCCDGAPAFGNAGEAIDAIEAWTQDEPEQPQPARAFRAPPDAADCAFALASSLERAARRDGARRFWISRHPLALGTDAGDWNTGSAGTAIALAAAHDARPRPETEATLRAVAAALLDYEAGPQPPGLYVGHAGRAAAILRVGRVLEDERLVDRAAGCLAGNTNDDVTSPDLFNGKAGLLRANLAFWQALGQVPHLDAAIALGNALVAESAGDPVGARWTIPPGHAALSDQIYLGYAHGLAGIADTLLDLHDETRDAALAACIQGAVSTLAATAVAVGPYGRGLNWPSQVGAPGTAAAYWCHGAAGIGQFLLRVAAAGIDDRALPLAERAMLATASTARWARPTPCHGLAGAIDALIDAFQVLGDEHWLAEASALWELMSAFTQTAAAGRVIEAESSSDPTPDFMLGYAGMIPILLRLSEPRLRPSCLSLSGLRFRAARPAGVPAGSGPPHPAAVPSPTIMQQH